MNDKYNRDIQEAFLKSAFKEAAELEFSEMGKNAENVKYPTDRQKREIERAIKKTKKKKTSVLRYIAATIAIVFSLTFAVLMLQPTVRAAIIDVVVEFFEDYLNIKLAPDTKKEFPLGDYTITYIPEGYTLTDSKDTQISNLRTFSKGDNVFSIYYYSHSIEKTSINILSNSYYEITINGMKGYYIEYKDPDMNNLIWGDDTYSFSIRGTLPKKELIKIAENIK